MADIFKILEASTAHISQEAATLFDSDDDFQFKKPYMQCEFGWLFLVPEADSESMQSVDSVGCKGFKALITYAQKNGCDYLVIDSILDIIEGLPVFDW